jgi:hypothetical protein
MTGEHDAKRNALATALITGALAATGAAAETFKKYGKEGDWEIVVNEKMGPGCLAIQKSSNPTSQIQLGIDAISAEKTGYIAIYVEDAEGIEAGQEIPASFDVDGEVFKGTFTGQQTKGFGGAFVPVNNAAFIYDLAKKHTLTISYGEGNKVIVDLAGTDAAFAALRACQEAQ